ncbi:hypothetical protein [Pseudomaricurvus sp.]|uniref:hypothetical protein n=1 Tax=Pseudomaricurvus sp. TaxID=2004510 RepID=UPI003F6CEBF0
MKLTKEEKDQLLQEIADDLPEYFAIFSPWMSLWLVNILLSCIAIGSVVNILADLFNVSFKYAYLFGLAVAILLIASNILIASGRRSMGTRPLQIFGYCSVAFGLLALTMYFKDGAALILILLGSGFLSILITHSVKFQVFAYHREKMGAWGRERIKKNRAFVEKVKASRRK